MVEVTVNKYHLNVKKYITNYITKTIFNVKLLKIVTFHFKNTLIFSKLTRTFEEFLFPDESKSN